MINTAEFLRDLLLRPPCWSDDKAGEAVFALARKCDLTRVLHREYGDTWEKQANPRQLDLPGWESFVEVLFKAAATAPRAEKAVKLLNSAANAVSIMQKQFSIDCGPLRERWQLLIDGVFDERT